MGLSGLISALVLEGFVVQITNGGDDRLVVNLRKRFAGRWLQTQRAIKRTNPHELYDFDRFVWDELRDMARAMRETIEQLGSKSCLIWREKCFHCGKALGDHDEVAAAACDALDTMELGKGGAC